ncbi:MAG: FecR domain-containing protein [Verrucomicrobiota bacterium]
MKTLLLTTLGLLFANLMFAGQVNEPIVQVYLVKGDVTLIDTSNNQTRPLQRGDLISEGYAVETGANSSALLLFSNGSSINVTPESYLDISEFSQEPFEMSVRNYAQLSEDPSASNTSLDLHYGKVVGNVRKLNSESSYVINSPTGSAGIRGTTFVFATLSKDDAAAASSDQLSSSIAVLAVGEGQVIITVNGVETVVNEGESVQIPVTFRDGGVGILEIESVGSANVGSLTPEQQQLLADNNQAIADAAADAFLLSPGGEAGPDTVTPLRVQDDPTNFDNLGPTLNVTNTPS